MDMNESVSLDYSGARLSSNNNSADINQDLDFLSELLDNSPEENELNCANSLHADYQKVIEDLPNSALASNNDNVQKNGDSQERLSLPVDLSKQNKKLKRTKKCLKKENIALQRAIISFQLKLAQSMMDLCTTKKELEESRKYKTENGTLMFRITLLESELTQYRGLKLRNDEEELKIKELEKKLSDKIASNSRLKGKSASLRSVLAKKDAEVRKVKHHNKQMMCFLTEFGDKLSKAGLLTENCRKDFFKKYEKLVSSEISKSNDGKIDLSEMPSAVFDTSLTLADKVNLDNFDICI